MTTMNVSAVQTNSLMKYDPVTAMEVPSVLVKRMIAPFPMLIATYSSFAGLHPAIFAHSVFPVCIIPICFMAFVLLAQTLFKERDSRKSIEIFFILLIMIFGGYAVAYAISEKSVKKGVELMLTAWPSLVFFVIYIVAETLQRINI